VETNPALGVRLPSMRTVRPKITLDPSHVARILEALEEPYVDFERRLLFIRRTYYQGKFGLPKNENSERVVPLGHGLVAALQHHRQHVQHGATDFVFPKTLRGKPYEPNNLGKRVLHATLTALGLTKTGWRTFRRSVATALSEMREPVRTAQQILGHSSAQMRRQRWHITFNRWKSPSGVQLRNQRK